MSNNVNAQFFMSEKKERMVRYETRPDGSFLLDKDGNKVLIDVMLPVGRGFNKAENAQDGIQEYKNMGMGWMTWNEYEDHRRKEEAEKKLAEAKKGK